MPNHIQNRLKFTCSPERLEDVLEAIKYEDDGENRDVGRGTIDFNKLIPMQQSLLKWIKRNRMMIATEAQAQERTLTISSMQP